MGTKLEPITMSLNNKENCVYSKERFDSLPNVIKRFFRFFYSNEVQLMKFDRIPYFPKKLSFISHVFYPDIVDEKKVFKEIYLINSSKDSYSGGYSLSKSLSNLRSKFENKNENQPIIYYKNDNYRFARILEILTFLRAFERNNLFQMEPMNYAKGYGEDSGLYLLFRLSNNYSVGLRNYGNLDGKIDLDNFLHKIIKKDYEYLDHWTSGQLRRYCKKNSLLLSNGRRKIDFVKTIQNSNPSVKPRLPFIQNLLKYPPIFLKLLHRHKENIDHHYVYVMEVEKWPKQKIMAFFDKNDIERRQFVEEHLLNNKENKIYLKLLERDLAQKENKIRKDVKKLFPEKYNLIFPKPIKPKKIENSKLYDSKAPKFNQVKIKTDDFRMTRNIGQRGECYVCYNVLLSDLKKKYPDGKLINNEWENDFYLEKDGKEIARVIWNNEVEESFDPYDILLIDDNEELFVEVKASINNYINFTISQRELNFAKEKNETC